MLAHACTTVHYNNNLWYIAPEKKPDRGGRARFVLFCQDACRSTTMGILERSVQIEVLLWMSVVEVSCFAATLTDDTSNTDFVSIGHDPFLSRFCVCSYA